MASSGLYRYTQASSRCIHNSAMHFTLAIRVIGGIFYSRFALLKSNPMFRG